jgi:hypothetical protein
MRCGVPEENDCMKVTDIPGIASVTCSSQVGFPALNAAGTCTDLPSTAKLLVGGGDARIAPGPDGLVNKYGCRPFPDPDLLAFGSSTASTISAHAFDAARGLREKIAQTLKAESAASLYTSELGRIRAELKSMCGVADMADLDIVFAASGTDLHLIASRIAAGAESRSTRIIMAGAEETGSGVPLALAGKHFSTRSALGQPVAEGICMDSGAEIEISTVPIRCTDGSMRPHAQIDADIESLVEEAIKAGQRILLILVDVSKTGVIAPSPACAVELHRRYPRSIDVLVDACQFRIAPDTLRAYLEQGFWVALTGSKFVTGPTFSGALLLPAPVSQRLRGKPLTSALRPYCARADWPDNWHGADIFDDIANFGLLLRWEAALEELRLFRSVPQAEISRFLAAFGRAIQERLEKSACFEPLPVPSLDRRAISGVENWDHRQTIFPFLLYHPAADFAKTPLNREQTQQIYRLLQADSGDGLRCQLGQPVPCGSRNGIPVAALRICASARLVVEGCAANGKNAAAVIARALDALDKTAILVGLGRFQ